MSTPPMTDDHDSSQVQQDRMIVTVGTLFAIIAGGSTARLITEVLWTDQSLAYVLVDVAAWVALLWYTSHISYGMGYHDARNVYKTRLDNLTAILPGHGPEWKVYLKGKKVGARSMRDRAADLVDAGASTDEVRDLPLIHDREWTEATQEPRDVPGGS